MESAIHSSTFTNARPLNAARWLQGLYDQIDTLQRFPERCALAREREYLEEDLRQLVFKSHRIIFRIDKARRAVYVLHVRHATRTPWAFRWLSLFVVRSARRSRLWAEV